MTVRTDTSRRSARSAALNRLWACSNNNRDSNRSDFMWQASHKNYDGGCHMSVPPWAESTNKPERSRWKEHTMAISDTAISEAAEVATEYFTAWSTKDVD